MTDTEAKALALVNEIAAERGEITYGSLGRTGKNVAGNEALCRAIEREAATEARHAAELREQAERFSEAVERVLTVPDRWQETHAWRTLSPFILPAPDPLVEALKEAYDAAVAELGEDYIRKLSWFPSNRKIGEAGE